MLFEMPLPFVHPPPFKTCPNVLWFELEVFQFCLLSGRLGKWHESARLPHASFLSGSPNPTWLTNPFHSMPIPSKGAFENTEIANCTVGTFFIFNFVCFALNCRSVLWGNGHSYSIWQPKRGSMLSAIVLAWGRPIRIRRGGPPLFG